MKPKSNIKIFLGSFSPTKLGYEPYYSSFVKRDNLGRFHMLVEGYGYYSIHYDLYVGGKHMALPSTHKLPEEIKRLRKLTGYIKPLKRKVKAKPKATSKRRLQ